MERAGLLTPFPPRARATARVCMVSRYLGPVFASEFQTLVLSTSVPVSNASEFRLRSCQMAFSSYVLVVDIY
jgi:hypothetical protein